jgi:hypothetical protein
MNQVSHQHHMSSEAHKTTILAPLASKADSVMESRFNQELPAHVGVSL